MQYLKTFLCTAMLMSIVHASETGLNSESAVAPFVPTEIEGYDALGTAGPLPSPLYDPEEATLPVDGQGNSTDTSHPEAQFLNDAEVSLTEFLNSGG